MREGFVWNTAIEIVIPENVAMKPLLRKADIGYFVDCYKKYLESEVNNNISKNDEMFWDNLRFLAKLQDKALNKELIDDHLNMYLGIGQEVAHEVTIAYMNSYLKQVDAESRAPASPPANGVLLTGVPRQWASGCQRARHCSPICSGNGRRTALGRGDEGHEKFDREVLELGGQRRVTVVDEAEVGVVPFSRLMVVPEPRGLGLVPGSLLHGFADVFSRPRDPAGVGVRGLRKEEKRRREAPPPGAKPAFELLARALGGRKRLGLPRGLFPASLP